MTSVTKASFEWGLQFHQRKNIRIVCLQVVSYCKWDLSMASKLK